MLRQEYGAGSNPHKEAAMQGTAVRYEHSLVRTAIGDKDLSTALDYFTDHGYELVAVHAIGVKFYLFAKRPKEQ